MSRVLLHAPATRFEASDAVDLSDAAERSRLSAAATRAMVKLAEQWKLTVEQAGVLLGGVPSSTWHAWKASPPTDLGFDRLTRISLLLGIYASLHALYSDSLADEWIRRPNSNLLFDGRTPLEVMEQGGIPTMAEVRALLDGRRGGL